MERLIIEHGERVTEHAFHASSLTVGRDPECDLFFADRKLSRRHARFEREADGVRLVDLGSRNGSWVNEERVTDRVLGPGDVIRLGSLQIHIEAEAPVAQSAVSKTVDEPTRGDGATVALPAPKPDESEGPATVVLSAEAAASAAAKTGSLYPEDSATRMLPTSPAPPELAETGTLALNPQELPDSARTSDSAGPPLEDSATVVLSRDVVSDKTLDQTGTVVLEAPAVAEPSDDSSTMFLPADSVARQDINAVDDDGPGTVILPVPRDSLTASKINAEDPTLPRPESLDKTVIVQRGAPINQDTGAVVIHGTVDPKLSAATRAVSVSRPAPRPDEVELEEEPLGLPDQAELSATGHPRAPLPELEPIVVASKLDSARFVALVCAVSILAFAVLVLPLLRSRSAALAAESVRRGQVLAELLAAKNQTALVETRMQALTAAGVAGELGVKAVFILSPSGENLLSAGAATAATPFEGVDMTAESVRTPRRVDLGDGISLFATPIKGEGRRVGVAVVHFDEGASQPGGTGVLLLLGSLLLLLSTSAAVFLARRWTLLPVADLRADVEALRNGILVELPEQRPYSELSVIARSFNEMLQPPDELVEPVDKAASGSDPTVLSPGPRRRTHG